MTDTTKEPEIPGENTTDTTTPPTPTVIIAEHKDGTMKEIARYKDMDEARIPANKLCVDPDLYTPLYEDGVVKIFVCTEETNIYGETYLEPRYATNMGEILAGEPLKRVKKSGYNMSYFLEPDENDKAVEATT